MTWETVGEDIVALDVDESIEGTYAGKASTFDGRELPNPVHTFKTEAGDTVAVWASWDLNEKLDGLEGNYVRVTFKGSRDTGEVIDGEPKTVKTYKVQVRRG